MIRHVLEIRATRITLAFVNNPDLERDNRVQGTLFFRGVQHLKEVDTDPRKGNGGEMKRPRKDCAKCGCAHIG